MSGFVDIFTLDCVNEGERDGIRDLFICDIGKFYFLSCRRKIPGLSHILIESIVWNAREIKFMKA